MLHVGHCLGTIFFGAFHNGVDDFVTNSSQLVVVTAAGVALNGYQIRHHVGGHAAGNNADIGGGFLINATVTLYVRQGLGRNHDSVDALFRLDAAMGLFAVDLDSVAILPRRAHYDFPGCALAVQGVAHVGAQAGLIHAARAIDAALFCNGEKNLDIAVRRAAFRQQAQALQNAYHAALVIAA